MDAQDDSLHFVAVVEPGDLERKCVLLVESIRTFGGALARSPCWLVQPRKGGRLTRRTMERFYELDARFVAVDLNRDWPHYPIANKIFATAFVERLLADDDAVLCFLDSDIVCLAEPSDLLLEPRHDVGLVPVDKVGRGQPAGEAINDYWRRIYDICGVDPERVWSVRTSVERAEIAAYFNAGMIAARRRFGLFNRWLEALARAGEAGPFERKQLHNLDQALLAGIALGQIERERVAILGSGYNYPLHLHEELAHGVAAADTERIPLAHYHGLFYKRACLDRLPFARRHREWLEPRLPIESLWQRQIRRTNRRRSKTAAGGAPQPARRT